MSIHNVPRNARKNKLTFTKKNRREKQKREERSFLCHFFFMKKEIIEVTFNYHAGDVH